MLVFFVPMNMQNDIVARCKFMKINRIVGQSTLQLGDILTRRQHVYENCYDIRIIVSENETVAAITTRILKALNKKQEFVSTRGDGRNNKYIIFIHRLSVVFLLCHA